MYKPNSLRKHITSANPSLKKNPDKLHVYVDEGNVVGTPTSSLSFQYHYKLNLIIEDYTGSADAIMVPLMAWVKIHQPDLILSEEKRSTGIQFEVDIINHETVDISIKISLTERIIVKPGEGGRLEIKHAVEPQPTPEYADNFWTLYDGENLIAEWHALTAP